MTMDAILFVILGLVVGVLARIVAASEDSVLLGEERGSFFASMIVGVLGSFLGGLVGRVLGLYREADPASYFMALAGSVLVLLAYHAIVSRRAAL